MTARSCRQGQIRLALASIPEEIYSAPVAVPIDRDEVDAIKDAHPMAWMMPILRWTRPAA